MSILPSIAFEIATPRLAWRGDTGRLHDDATTAADVIRHEQETRGLLLDLSPALIAYLAAFHATALLWVTFKRSEAARYGPPLPVEIDEPAHVIGRDHQCGFLLFFCDDPTITQSGDATTQQAREPPPEKKPPRRYSAGTFKALASSAVLTAAAIAIRHHREAMSMTTNRTPDLADDRRAELGKRIDALQTDAEKITTERGQTALGHYRAHQSDFEGKQQLIGAEIDKAPEAACAALENAKEAQGHDYAAFLAGRLEDFHTRDSSADGHNAAQYYGGLRSQHTETAAMLRGGEPEKPTPPKGRDDAPEGATLDHAPGSKYDPLRQSEEAAKALIVARELAVSKDEQAPGDTAAPAKQPEPEDEEKKKGGSSLDNDPARPQHLRLVAAAEPTPHGTSSTRSTYLDPNENPDLPAYKEAVEEPRPMHPDDHTAPEQGPEIGGYVLFSREAKNGAERFEGIYAEKGEAVAEARKFPPTQEAAKEEGRGQWGELHAITPELFADKSGELGDRLLSLESLYSSAKETGGAMIPAAEHEAGAVSFSRVDAEAGRIVETQGFAADLSAVAGSRDVAGHGPAEREILMRQEAEGTARQEGELAASKGEQAPGSETATPKTYDDYRAAKAATYREAADAAKEAEPMAEPTRPAFGGRGD